VIKYVEKIEECSGLCKPALFYDGYVTALGKPYQTCFTAIRTAFHGKLELLTLITFVVPILGFLVFLVHFTIYGKKQLLESEQLKTKEVQIHEGIQMEHLDTDEGQANANANLGANY